VPLPSNEGHTKNRQKIIDPAIAKGG